MPEAEKVQLKINCNMELKNADNLHIFKQVQNVPEDAQKPFESPWGPPRRKSPYMNGMPRHR